MPKSNSAPDMERLVAQYGTAVLRVAYLYLKDMYLAEDAIQETFLRVYKHYGGFREKAAEKTWIYRIVINVCKTMQTKSWWKRIDDSVSIAEIEAYQPETESCDPTVSIEIMKLPPRYKQVVLLYYYQGFTVKEVATILHITESAAGVRLKRARDQLKKQLKGWYSL